MKSGLLEKEKLIVILRNVPTERLIDTAEALLDGGVRFAEIPFGHPESGAAQTTARAISMLCERYQGRLCVGAGTVLSVRQAELAAEAGAEYIISPNSERSVIERTKELGLVSIPGAVTPTEIVQAYGWGADYIKLFPAADLGVSYLKSLLAPLPYIPMIAVGGLNEFNFMDFIKTGIAGIGVGSTIANPGLINQGRYSEITRLAGKFTSTLAGGE